uniref:ORF67g n=1 Tax=Pinus koraiensis TaxID=88728 RepID=A4QME9_PINKO|nr:ORF67g [Pinus koraiensis]ABP35486.1 ORF67g [Pinus koraiensis]
MRVGKGYNSAVECHLDMVEVISSSLIIPKPNVSPSIKQIFVFHLIALFTPESSCHLHEFFFMVVKKK